MTDRFKSRQGRPPKYPWDLWTNGKAHKLYKGKDFDAQLLSFRTMVHRRARDLRVITDDGQVVEYGAYTHINEAHQSVTIRFYRRDEE